MGVSKTEKSRMNKKLGISYFRRKKGREREQKKNRLSHNPNYDPKRCIQVYIYIYRERERETDRLTGRETARQAERQLGSSRGKEKSTTTAT